MSKNETEQFEDELQTKKNYTEYKSNLNNERGPTKELFSNYQKRSFVSRKKPRFFF